MIARRLKYVVISTLVTVAIVTIYQIGHLTTNRVKLYTNLRRYVDNTFTISKLDSFSGLDAGDVDQMSISDFLNLASQKKRTIGEVYKSKTERHVVLIKDIFRDPLGDYQLRNFTHEMITAEPTCKDPPFLLIQIHSSPNHYRSREAIRLSWGNPQNSMNRNQVSKSRYWQTVFVIGQSEIPEYNALVHHESCRYNDILITDFMDTYRNLSRKTVYTIRWSARKCVPKYMLKTDEDCYVNPFNIIDFLDTYDKKRNRSALYTGRVQWVMTPYRDNTSRYYISEEDYPFDVIPPYVSGGGYLFSGFIIPRLANASKKLRIIPNEDANFGLLMHAIDVDPVEDHRIIPYIYCDIPLWRRSICDFVEPFVIHGVTTHKHMEIHYSLLALRAAPFICKHLKKLRKRTDPPLYCPTS